jgi:hypothetical protein
MNPEQSKRTRKRKKKESNDNPGSRNTGPWKRYDEQGEDR